MNNIVLVGMPGSGKSTVGVLLAKALGYGFLDVDLVIQRQEGALLQEILDTRGVDAFLDAEVEYIWEAGIFLYKPLSVYRADGTYPFARYFFADDEAYLSFCRAAEESSRFAKGEDVLYGADSSVFPLITCTNSITSKTCRYVFQAVLDTVYLVEE